MAFYLEYSGFDGGFLHYFVKHLVIGIEVADTERTHFAHLYGLFHIFPRTHKVANGLVDVKQIYIVRLKSSKHFINGFQRFAFAVFCRPELAGYPDFFAWNAAFP